MLGLGTWKLKDGPICETAVRDALDLGYRHLDTAQDYQNEASVGKALHDSAVARGDVFITTKFFPESKAKDPVRQLEESLAKLGVDHVDLYLVHWPAGGPEWAWEGMQQAKSRGLARAIGVSNFSAADVEKVVASAGAIPAVNQVQLSALRYRRQLIAACEEQQIVVEAYSPLGTGRHLKNTTVAHVAERVERTPAQVLLRWCIQHNLPVIPKSAHRERVAENARIFDFSLSDDDMAILDKLDTTDGTGIAVERTWWK
jgi:diketogulonate reductase-like aldo/keto reductase